MENKKPKHPKENPVKDLAIDIGRMPPNAIEFEKIVIGTCLIESGALERCVNMFGDKADIFYDPKHVILWEAFYNMYTRKLPVDMITVIMELKRTEKLSAGGGDDYIIGLTMQVSSSAHLEYHSRIILEKYFARTLQYHCAGSLGKLFSDTADVFDELESIRGAVQGIEEQLSQQKQSINSREAHGLLLQDYKLEITSVVPCDYADLKDNFLGGQAGDLILLGARPSIGKTAVALNFASRCALQGIGAEMFCLEMVSVQMQKRLAANICDVSFYKLNRKILNDNELVRLTGEQAAIIEKMPLYFDESRNLFQILSKIRILAKKGVKLFVIDYVQIITTEGIKFGTREQEVAYISRNLKAIALELGVVVMALAQLGKHIDQRAVKRPISSDLRESNALENDADIIILLYRPEFYGIKTWDREWGGQYEQPTDGQIELIFSKYRNGRPFEQRMRFWGDKMRLNDFSNPDEYQNYNRTYNDNGEDGRKELPNITDDDFAWEY